MIKFPRVHYDGLEYAVVHFEKVILKWNNLYVIEWMYV